MAIFIGQLLLLLQRLLPKRLITAIVYRIARIRLRWIKNALIRGFVRLYDVNLEEVSAAVPDDFASLNDFFIRDLVTGARPIDSSASSIVSPADGFISASGRIERNGLIQAKGRDYTLEDLLATDLADAERYCNGSFMTIYLAPHNYHRVHAPLAGELLAARFVPGALYSVSPMTVAHLRGLFTRNERLVCHFNTPSGPYAMGWTGELRPRKGNVAENIDLRASPESLTVDKGDLIGWFNMGSTIILLLPPAVCDWNAGLESGTALSMGEAIGHIASRRPEQ
jgi:phosphatidylserine decarboxylase